MRIETLVETLEQRAAHRIELRPSRNRHQVLPSNPFAATLDAALVVTGIGSREAGLQELVLSQCRESWR